MRCYDGLPVTNAGKRIKNLLKLECPPVMTLEARWGVKHIEYTRVALGCTLPPLWLVCRYLLSF